MRADRLLAMMMLLQARGRLTAAELARELEVSVRTVYRDLDALSAAGVPVYAESGPGGGCTLLDSYRTTLTGLNGDELRALFTATVTIPAAMAELGLGQEIRNALLKLSASLPAESRRSEAWVRQRIHLDWTGGQPVPEPLPHLPAVQRAVWDDLRLRMTYRLPIGPLHEAFERTVEPYGLVAKAGAWHLVCAAAGRLHVYSLAWLLDVQVLDERFERPADFDLASFWAEWYAEYAGHRADYAVTARVSPGLAHWLPQYFGAAVREQLAAAAPDAAGWRTVTLAFQSLEAARARLLGFGAALEVLAPLPLRLSLADFAARTAALYASRQPPGLEGDP